MAARAILRIFCIVCVFRVGLTASLFPNINKDLPNAYKVFKHPCGIFAQPRAFRTIVTGGKPLRQPLHAVARMDFEKFTDVCELPKNEQADHLAQR